jgi:hypothetical protein
MVSHGLSAVNLVLLSKANRGGNFDYHCKRHLGNLRMG